MLPGFWDRYAQCYDTLCRLVPYRELMATLVEEAHIQPGMNVLDAGCGTGNLTHLLIERYPQISLDAVDFSDAMLKRARRKVAGRRVIFSQIDLSLPLPFETDRFDAVLSNNVLYTLPDPQVTVTELLRVLRPGGRLVVSTPAANARLFPILSDHLGRQGPASLVPAALPLFVLGLCNLLILKRARSGYHFFDQETLCSLTPCPPIKLLRAYAGQNWLAVWRKEC